MSTMLKTAAMTLLSKTLQTFLYKYLLDVDVEGVALPSLYDTDGHSGWGVRLCNVKLREGVALMEVLPGCKKKTKIRKRKTTKTTTTKTVQRERVMKKKEKCESESATPGKMQEQMHEDYSSHHRRTATTSTPHQTTTPARNVVNEKVLGTNSETSWSSSFRRRRTNPVTASETFETRPLLQQQPQQVVRPDDHAYDETTHHHDTHNKEQHTVMAESDTDRNDDDDDDDDDAASHVSSHLSSSPPTPPSSSAGGFLSNCFANSSSSTVVAGISPAKTRERKHSLEGMQRVPDLNVVEGPIEATTTTISSHDNLEKDVKASTANTSSYKVTTTKLMDDDDEDDDDDEEEDEDEEEVIVEADEEEDEEYIFEERMGLRLGKGGRIGVLDVRLIGKELHVLVEDAFLTVEAVPKEPSYVDESQKKKDQAKPADQKAAEAAANNKKGKEPRTVGEKVMAENSLARALAAIPHLFLRDIRIRFIIRDQMVTKSAAVDDTKGNQDVDHDNDDDLGEHDCAVEFGIEFLSVASGEDLLGQFKTDDDDVAHRHPQKEAATSATEEKAMHTSFSSLSELQSASDQHEYLSKRIRTGKGPEGGIWAKIIPPKAKMVSQGYPLHSNVSSNNTLWARQRFLTESQYYLFRCSGLDIRTRIYLGTKKEIAIMNNEYVWYGNEYDEYTLDSLLYGVDYISTGSKPPLPPIVERKDSISSVSADKNSNLHAFQLDENGIYSCPMKSSFHRVARGLKPSMCQRHHLPSDDCSHCWERHASSKSHGVVTQHEHELDSSLPMPGLVLNLSMKDPIEINVDRPELDVLGLALQLFTPNNSAVPDTPPTKPEEKSKEAKGTERKKSITGLLLRGKDRRKNDLRNSFPAYMQPQSIQVMGLYLSKIFVRVHVMRRNDFDDLGLKFGYWDLEAQCVTADFQELKASHHFYQDIRFDVGLFITSERKGISKQKLVSLGVPYAGSNVDSELLTLPFTSVESQLHPKSAWPSTASVLLHVPPPLGSHLFETRDRHALQARFYSLSSPKAQVSETFAHANLRVGVTSVNMPFVIKDEILAFVDEAMASIFGRQHQAPLYQTPDATSDPSDVVPEAAQPQTSAKSTIKYKMQIDGGEVNVYPLISLRLPLTQFSGTQSSELGVFLETCLERLQVQYGESPNPTWSHQSGTLDLQQLAALPEGVRLRILLCLKDLKPLEKALGVEKASSSFLRCVAVNKGLVKMAKRVISKPLKQHQRHQSSQPLPRTRQELLTELLKLDNHSLSDLLSTHELQKKKLPRS